MKATLHAGRAVAAMLGATLGACGCGPSLAQLRAVEYAPQARGDWASSTPRKEGLDPLLVAQLYYDAAELETLYGLLVVKNDRLVAEKYFNGSDADDARDRMSTTKSVVSALAGIAVKKGCLQLDQPVLQFFGEYSKQLRNTAKAVITVEQLLQMRAGYPWEGIESPYFERIFLRKNYDWLPLMVEFPLTRRTGAEFGYSNLTSHLIGIAVARGCDTDLLTMARMELFEPLGASVSAWHKAADGYYFGAFGIHVTARDMAKFGSLYLHDGEYRGKRVLAREWVTASLRRYSEGINFTGWFSSELGSYFEDLGYGYQWWSAFVGGQRVDFAWGHGGSLILLRRDLDLVVVVAADPLYDFPESEGWQYEGRIIDLLGKFLASLPSGHAG